MLQAEVDAEAHAAVVTVSGDLDIAAAPALRTNLADLMGGGVRRVEISLEGCTFLDSSGLGALLWASHRLAAAGGELVVTGAHGAPARTMALAGVDHVIAGGH
jgi:anti-sigma B factor antagonist